MKKSKPVAPRPLLNKILKKIAPTIGARLVLEPEWGIVGQIIFKSGRKRYFRYSTIDINTMGASEIAKDKDYANFFLKKSGYPIIEGQSFFSKIWAEAIGSKKNIQAAYKYAVKLGFPVIVKPNSGSQGVGVTKVFNKQELYKALNFIFARDRVALVQRPVVGKDYRIVVLDNKIISAYQRVPLSVTGDGQTTVLQLLKRKQKTFEAASRDTLLKITDPRIGQKLKHDKLTLRSVPTKNQIVYLLDNANLSTGGDSIDVTDKMHLDFKKIAINITKDMGLRLCGVDLMVAGDITKAPGKYWVIEINSAPGLDHYVQTGKKQQQIVEDMYLEVLKAME